MTFGIVRPLIKNRPRLYFGDPVALRILNDSLFVEDRGAGYERVEREVEALSFNFDEDEVGFLPGLIRSERGESTFEGE